MNKDLEKSFLAYSSFTYNVFFSPVAHLAFLSFSILPLLQAHHFCLNRPLLSSRPPLDCIIFNPVNVLADPRVDTGVAGLRAPDAPRDDAHNRPPVLRTLLQEEGAAAVTLGNATRGLGQEYLLSGEGGKRKGSETRERK